MRIVILLLPLLLIGCASGTGVTTIGTHGKDSTLSNNTLKGFYLFKIENQMNTINVTSRDMVRIKL